VWFNKGMDISKQDLFEEIVTLESRLKKANLPLLLLTRASEMLIRLSRMAKFGAYSVEYESTSRYIEWIIRLPWGKKTEDILDLSRAKQIFDEKHHGLTQVKERILEYLAVLKLKRTSRGEVEIDIKRAPILCLVGLVGTGKTTFASSIAEALGRKFERIPFGGMGDPYYLRGRAKGAIGAEPGQIMKALARAKTKNPVILLDEIDRVTTDSRATIMGVLVELLDPEQNSAFIDHYIDFPFDLSQVLFIATCNNTTNISTAVLDRMEPIQMPSYTDEEKIIIGRDYTLPRVLVECGLKRENLVIENDVWPKVVRPLGFDAGIRTLERTIEGICRKVARLIVEGKGNRFVINTENMGEFLPKW